MDLSSMKSSQSLFTVFLCVKMLWHFIFLSVFSGKKNNRYVKPWTFVQGVRKLIRCCSEPNSRNIQESACKVDDKLEKHFHVVVISFFPTKKCQKIMPAKVKKQWMSYFAFMWLFKWSTSVSSYLEGSNNYFCISSNGGLWFDNCLSFLFLIWFFFSSYKTQ